MPEHSARFARAQAAKSRPSYFREWEVLKRMEAGYLTLEPEKRLSASVKAVAETPVATGEEVKKPLSLSAAVFPLSAEQREDGTFVRARAVFTLVYLAENGCKKSESVAEVEGLLPLKGKATVSLSLSDVRYSRLDQGFTAYAAVLISGEAFEKEPVSCVTGEDGAFVKEKTETIETGTGITTGSLLLEDEFELNYPVENVLSHREEVCVTKVQGGISSVIAEGEVAVYLAVMPLAENGEIVREKRKIPFRCEFENGGALPTMKARCDAEIRKVAFRVATDDVKNRSVVSSEISLGFYGEATDEQSVTVAADLYSRTVKLETERTDISSSLFFGQKTERVNVSEKSTGDIPEGGRLIAPLGERILSWSVTEREGFVTVDGIAKADLLFRNGDNGITSVPSETPFSFDLAVEGKACGIRLHAEDFSPKLRGGAIETDFTVVVSYFDYGEKKISCISAVTETGERERSDAAIGIFLPKRGDELWDVAKQLGEDGDFIAKLNPDLTFPLTGEERIVIYRQKK